jgi:ribosome-associated heat shock protein Hsp15
VERVRIDKWLWAARFFKTRGAATEAVNGGRVHVNDVRAKPSKDVAVGDVVELTVGEMPWTVVVRGIADKRGPASLAATLYEETPESRQGRERRIADRRHARPVGADRGARPTKRDRRRIDDVRGRGGRPRG